MTFDLLWTKVLPQVWDLTLTLSLGVFIGVLLEVSGCLKKLAKYAGPLLSLGRFSPESGAAFVASFGSTKAAHAMLASAYRGGKIQRRELVLSAVANSLPSTLLHLKFFAPLMISVLGAVGAAYVGFVIGAAVLVFLVAVVLSRLLVSPTINTVDAEDLKAVSVRPTPKIAARMMWDRWWKMTLRVLLVAIPVYAAVDWIQAEGGFKWIASILPSWVDAIFPVQSMSIIVAQLSGTTAAVSTTKSLLESGALSGTQVFFTLLAGYCLALPVKVLRRSLPSAVSIFPDTTGFWIIGVSQGVRLLLAVSMVGTYMVIAS